jgi:putative tricarboxylic transport membrane protein
MMETALRQSLIKSKGSFSIFFTRPISAICILVALALMVLPLLPWFRRRRPGISLDQEDVT